MINAAAVQIRNRKETTYTFKVTDGPREGLNPPKTAYVTISNKNSPYGPFIDYLE
ncbi:MAG: hypothetical protein H0U27_00170 [Nitrosopumilus sp.]|nr:hypothetical protein [Nitrosopumilus sp.]